MSKSNRKRKNGLLRRLWRSKSTAQQMEAPSIFSRLVEFLNPFRLISGIWMWTTEAIMFRAPRWQTVEWFFNPPEFDVSWVHLINPLYWISWIFRFVWVWLTSRPYLSILPATPVFLVAALSAMAFVHQRYELRTEQRVATYSKAFNAAFRGEQWETANVALGTLMDLEPSNLNWHFQNGLLQAKIGRPDLSEEILTRLAYGRHYAPAALLIAKSRFEFDKLPTWSVEEHTNFAKRLESY